MHLEYTLRFWPTDGLPEANPGWEGRELSLDRRSSAHGLAHVCNQRVLMEEKSNLWVNKQILMLLSGSWMVGGRRTSNRFRGAGGHDSGKGVRRNVRRRSSPDGIPRTGKCGRAWAMQLRWTRRLSIPSAPRSISAFVRWGAPSGVSSSA